MTTPEELGIRLLSSIADEAELRFCLTQGVSADTFELEEHQKVFEYFRSHVNEKGELPSARDVEVLCGVKLEEPGDLESFVKEARSQEAGRKARRLLNEELPKMDADPGGAVSRISDGLSELRTKGGKRPTYLDGDSQRWLAWFDEDEARKGEGKLLGVPTGLKCIDLTGVGFLDGNLVCILGGLYVGKSWLSMNATVAAYDDGHKILFISPEMSVNEQGLVFQTIAAGRRKREFSHSGVFTRGANRKQYKEFLEELEQRHDFVCYDSDESEGGVFTYEGVVSLAREHRPKVLVVDGLHLLTSESKRGRSDWEIIKEGAAALKALALKMEMVVIVAHQTERSTVRDKGAITPPTLGQSGYGLAIEQSADIMISMSRSPADEFERLFRVIKARGRAPINGVRHLRWSVDSGQIEEVLPEHQTDDF